VVISIFPNNVSTSFQEIHKSVKSNNNKWLSVQFHTIFIFFFSQSITKIALLNSSSNTFAFFTTCSIYFLYDGFNASEKQIHFAAIICIKGHH